jgi:hypothetical protein
MTLLAGLKACGSSVRGWILVIEQSFVRQQSPRVMLLLAAHNKP